MSLNRFARKTDASQLAIVNGLRACGYTVEIIHKPVDLAVTHSGWNWMWRLMECKPEGWQTWSKAQKKQREFCQRYRIPVVRNLDEALEAMGWL